MKTKLLMLMLATTLLTTAHAEDKILPKACGSDSVQFDVKTNKSASATQPPSDGKAKIVFIQTYTIKGGSFLAFGTSDFTTRFGLDGVWAGAAGNNSYFSVEITPGVHHLCASVQGSSDAVKDMVGANLLTAEAGKIYYYQFNALKIHCNGAGCNYYSSSFGAINPDEGEYRVASSGLSTFSPKH
jgi:hypothetical protein